MIRRRNDTKPPPQPPKPDESRNLMFEELKNVVQKLSQLQQPRTTVNNDMFEQAKSRIRSSRP